VLQWVGITLSELPFSEDLPWLSIVCGSSILGLLVYFGNNRTQNSFPIACYPTFAYLAPTTVESLKVMVCFKSNKEQFHSRLLDQEYGSERIRGLFETILEEKNEQVLEAKLKAIWDWILQIDSKYKEAEVVEFYKVKMSTIPENYATNPISENLIKTFDVKTSN
jgi:hypothetical protein